MKAGFISILGRPSSGKSTLLNRVCGQKVSIVSPTPQTTRNKVRGIINRPEGQLVFIDTPGFHKSDKKLNLYLKRVIMSTFEEADVILYVIDLTRPIGEEEKEIIRILRTHKGPLVIALNKIDTPNSTQAEFTQELSTSNLIAPVVPVSALTGENVDKLISALFELTPEGDLMYPEDFYTDQDPEFRVSEIIREKAINKTFEELPHALYVEISDMEQHEEGLWVRGFIYVERESQKGILIGKQGTKIREIIREAEDEINTLFPYPVKIDIRVKVKPNWRKDDNLLKRLTQG
jgi:GTP-binding protein Era